MGIGAILILFSFVLVYLVQKFKIGVARIYIYIGYYFILPWSVAKELGVESEYIINLSQGQGFSMLVIGLTLGFSLVASGILMLIFKLFKRNIEMNFGSLFSYVFWYLSSIIHNIFAFVICIIIYAISQMRKNEPKFKTYLTEYIPNVTFIILVLSFYGNFANIVR
ncbi:hypothetical protein [uncultured Campylobacter sp.]|uniref:hypothetical protein n=1 Tax=uncultured Campylobacter sp. TaxID=218934 RepID=UPI0026207704|nr:hypothetical protein [uncultured Campylobacter sp.]